MIGVDYSLTSPAICVLPDDPAAKYDQATIHFLTGVKKAAKIRTPRLIGYEYPAFTSFQDRIGKISQWAIHVVREAGSSVVFLEGYSFASVGNSFDIAENTGLFKHKLHLIGGYDIRLVPPTSLKKFASGKGNAKKAGMAAAFWEENNIDIKQELGLTSENPSSDIVDAYFLARYGNAQAATKADVLQQIST